jgi:TRAP-type C4-dicarboxylate transport system permease small subunit
MRTLLALTRGLRLIEDAAVGTLLVLVCAVTAAQVVFRFILESPLSWSDELGTFSFVWFALLGAAIAVRENAHIGVDALTRTLPPRCRAGCAVGSLLLIQLFLLCLVKYGLPAFRSRSSGSICPSRLAPRSCSSIPSRRWEGWCRP